MNTLQAPGGNKLVLESHQGQDMSTSNVDQADTQFVVWIDRVLPCHGRKRLYLARPYLWLDCPMWAATCDREHGNRVAQMVLHVGDDSFDRAGCTPLWEEIERWQAARN